MKTLPRPQCPHSFLPRCTAVRAGGGLWDFILLVFAIAVAVYAIATYRTAHADPAPGYQPIRCMKPCTLLSHDLPDVLHHEILDCY